VSGWIASFLQWVSMHPHLAGLVVGFIACAEALAFIGLVVPGAALIVAAGALVGSGYLEFWGTFAWAVGGAVLGDGVSYWLGHHYRERLRNVGWLRRHPQWLTRGETFFQRHGGKSVVFARFVGPVRPVIPVVAGMLGMAPIQFYLYNVLSALAWALAHLLPGMAIGTSLVLASQVAARLVLVFAVLVLTVGLIVWLIQLSYRWLQPRAARWAAQATAWGRAHPRLGWFVADLFDPARPAVRGLLVWLVVLIAAGWLFLGVLEDVLTRDPLVYAGRAIYHVLQQLRTPAGDALMVVVTELGDAAVTMPLAAAVLIWLLWRRAWRDTFYWLTAVGFGALAVTLIKLLLREPRPVPIYSGAEAYSFPSSHATLSTVVYGLLAVFIAPAFAPRWRWIPYACAALLIFGIAFSRLYLGAHWLADVIAGVALGTAWIALLAIARGHHRLAPVSGWRLAAVALLVFTPAAAWHVHAELARDLARYAVRHPVAMMSTSEWQQKGWRKLPVWRFDLQGEREQPLNVQWAGDLHSIRQDLLSQGWREPPALSTRTALAWLLPNPTLAQLPVLPQLHDGQYESLLLVGNGSAETPHAQRAILRLWSAAVRLQPGDRPIWIGTVALLRLERLPLISFARSSDGYDQGLTALESDLISVKWKSVERLPSEVGEETHWSGTVLVIRTRH
jgi:membrane protein DedA with SNARE-associated domain/membrane-associated phospholipid phosphatase